MATKSVATQTEKNGEGLEANRNVLDVHAAAALFKVRSVLALGIEATMDRSLDRTFLHWPSVAEAAWDMLDDILVRAGLSLGDERPWTSAAEAKETP